MVYGAWWVPVLLTFHSGLNESKSCGDVVITAKVVGYGSQVTPLPLEGRRKVRPNGDANEVRFREVLPLRSPEVAEKRLAWRFG